MDEHLFLPKRIVGERAKGELHHVPVLAIRPEAQVPAQEPFRHQLHFGDQALLVVGRQVGRRHLRLHHQQGVERVAVERVGPGFVEFRQVEAMAEVGHQHEAGVGVRGAHPRRVQARGHQSSGDVQPGADVLAIGRGIHHDPRLAGR